MIAAISDTHGVLPDIPECDIFIHAGDICPLTNHTRPRQANWIEGYFWGYLNLIPAKHKIVMAGNHDWIFFDSKGMLRKQQEWPCHYLENSGVEINGLKIWGTPWTPHFCDWAFNFSDDPIRAEEQMAKIYGEIPEDIDILVTHGPPRGFGDLTRDTRRAGCKALLDRIKVVKPKIHVFGHIHDVDSPPAELVHNDNSRTWFYNVACRDEDYYVVKGATEIEV